MSKPQISIIMPIYNGEKYLAEAIDSILDQTFHKFEFIIINDGSTDNTLSILKKYSQHDSRIIIHNNIKNKGISESLNIGLRLANTPLIARMDADDFAYPQRLETQIKFMQDHPEITVCGSSMDIYEQEGEQWIPQINHEDISAKLFFNSCFYHPTTMYKKEEIINQGGYRKEFSGAEDYDLWQRLSTNKKVRFANIKQSLLKYRVHNSRNQYNKKQFSLATKVRTNHWTYLKLQKSKLSFTCYLALISPNDVIKTPSLKNCRKGLAELKEKNKHHKFYLEREMENKWLDLCLYVAKIRFDAVIQYVLYSGSLTLTIKFYRSIRIIWCYLKARFNSINK